MGLLNLNLFSQGLTMSNLTDGRFLDTKKEVVVLLLFLGGIHKEGPHHVGAVGFVADAEGTRDWAKMELVLITVMTEIMMENQQSNVKLFLWKQTFLDISVIQGDVWPWKIKIINNCIM